MAGAQRTVNFSSGARSTPGGLRAPAQHPGAPAVSALGIDRNSARHPLAPEAGVHGPPGPAACLLWAGPCSGATQNQRPSAHWASDTTASPGARRCRSKPRGCAAQCAFSAAKHRDAPLAVRGCPGLAGHWTSEPLTSGPWNLLGASSLSLCPPRQLE